MHIRPATRDDAAFVHRLVPRLVEFGPVPGRDPEAMIARDRAVLAASLDAPAMDDAIFIADDDAGNAVGFIHLATTVDYYSNATTGHVADIVVTPEAGGQGVGTALMKFAEDWARERGYRLLTLSVIPENQRARELYRRLGFREDWIRCVKRV